jgi:hypothetical protein
MTGRDGHGKQQERRRRLLYVVKRVRGSVTQTQGRRIVRREKVFEN